MIQISNIEKSISNNDFIWFLECNFLYIYFSVVVVVVFVATDIFISTRWESCVYGFVLRMRIAPSFQSKMASLRVLVGCKRVIDYAVKVS